MSKSKDATAYTDIGDLLLGLLKIIPAFGSKLYLSNQRVQGNVGNTKEP